MKSSLELRQEISADWDQAEAIMAVAKEENRELDAGEQRDVDAIMAAIGLEKDDDGKPSGKWVDVKRAERIEAHQQRLAEQRVQGLRPDGNDDKDGQPSFVIPKSAMYGCRKLRSFVGDAGHYEAYSSGQFFLALLGHDGARAWCQDHGVDIRMAMSTGDNKLGGYLVPQEFENTVIDLRESYGVFRTNVFRTTMASDSKTQPRRKAGLTAYAVGDNDEITASDKEWSQVELIAKKWGCLAKYSSEIDEDSVISIADNLADEMAYAFAKKEDEAGFIGDGTSTYHGISGITVKVDDGNHAGGIYTAATGNTTFATLDLLDFENAAGQLPQYAEDGAAWYISKKGYYASMVRLLDAGGGNTIADLGRGPERVFLGIPVRISQVLNTTLTAQTDTILFFLGNVNLSSTLGDRRGLSVMTTSDRYFELDQIGIKGTVRTAINNHDLGGSGATDHGPIVAMKTPAS